MPLTKLMEHRILSVFMDWTGKPVGIERHTGRRFYYPTDSSLARIQYLINKHSLDMHIDFALDKIEVDFIREIGQPIVVTGDIQTVIVKGRPYEIPY